MFTVGQHAEIEAMIGRALKKQEDDVGTKINAIIGQASLYSRVAGDKERSKTIHEAEVRAVADGEARADALVDKQKSTNKDCQDLVDFIKAQFSLVEESTKDLERMAAVVIAEQQTGIEQILVDLE